MEIKVKLDDGAIMPTRAHEEDAGMDLYAREDKTVWSGGSATFDTGVHVQIPYGYVGMLKSKSGLNIKHSIVSEGVIDCGYTGPIVVKLHNHGRRSYDVHAGDKITQLVIIPISLPEPVLVESLDETDRGADGFGSTGR